MSYVKVCVPATTANCGPGFDAVGMACTLYNDFELTLHPSGTGRVDIRIAGEGEDRLSRTSSNIVVQAILQVANKAGCMNPDIDLAMTNRIPLARGLGSSAAAIVGGVVCANEALGNPLTKEELLNIASFMEGHPDNVAPALYGGITLSIMEEEKAKTLRFMPPKDLKLIVAVPEFTLATIIARQVLPTKIPFGDAVFNVSRTALLVGALATGNYGFLSSALHDKLHQPYRQQLIKGMQDVFGAALKAGALGTVISGAGPCLIAYATGNEELIGEHMVRAFAKHSVNSYYLTLAIDAQGAHVCR